MQPTIHFSYHVDNIELLQLTSLMIIYLVGAVVATIANVAIQELVWRLCSETHLWIARA